MSIWTKLQEIQKAIPTFLNSEKADKKKAGSKDSEYLFTPGWQIVQAIRAEMDNRDIMMPVSVISETHEMVEYPVYKYVDGRVVSFIKKENLSTITVEYTWIDTVTGETAGPYRMIASGANGTDKSTASALSTAERYIFLKFFHIPCKDAGIELDAHDASNIPGFREQPAGATEAQIAKSKVSEPIRQIPPAEIPATPMTRPTYGKEYEDAINTIAMFAVGTQSHTEAVNRVLGALALAGYPAADKMFVETLIQIADERRTKAR